MASGSSNVQLLLVSEVFSCDFFIAAVVSFYGPAMIRNNSRLPGLAVDGS